MCARVYILFCVLAVAGGLPACHDELSVPSSSYQGDILPLATDNFWRFHRIVIDSNGAQVDTSLLMMIVGLPDTFGGERAYPVSSFPFRFVLSHDLFWTSRLNGLYNVIPDPDSVSATFLQVLKLPTKIGDSLTFIGYTIRTASVGDTVVVPAGSFRCIRYEILQNNEIVARLYAVPNIGIVKAWQRWFPETLVDELLSYRVR